MLDASARLLRLLSLLTARRFWVGRELAERLEVTDRTLRRDVEKLRSLGYPIRSTAGVAGGYELGGGAALPPLLLEDDEAVAVAVGLLQAASGALAGAAESAARALSKLEKILSPRLRKRVRALGSSVAALHPAAPPVAVETLARLAGACRDHELVSFDYSDRRGNDTRRQVEPHGLVASGARWYLAAWDRGREAFRTFRLDRVRQVAPEGRRFSARVMPEGSAAAYVSRSVSTGQYALTARVLLHAPIETMSARVSPLAGQLSRAGADRCLLETGGPALQPLAAYVAMLDCEFEVLDPPELVDAVRAVAQRLERAAALSRGASG